MLIFQKALANAFPKHLHPRVDTWLKTWMPDPSYSTALAASAASPAFLSNQPVMMAALYAAGVVSINASLLAWRLRGRKEWTLPHDGWKTAVANVETKLAPLVHMPHIHRTSALCDLSMVLKDMEMTRMVADARSNKAAGRPLADPPSTKWMDGYTTGTISALMLHPDVLDRVHRNLGFGQKCIEQWVEASYLQRIYQDINSALPGTRDALVQLSNENPATMAFYFVRYPHYFEVDPTRQLSTQSQQSQGERATEWFGQTQWPSWVASTREMHALLDPTPATDAKARSHVPPGPSPWELYQLATQRHVIQNDNGLPLDGSIFDTAESFAPSKIL